MAKVNSREKTASFGNISMASDETGMNNKIKNKGNLLVSSFHMSVPACLGIGLYLMALNVC